jgi:hypothetical protein
LVLAAELVLLIDAVAADQKAVCLLVGYGFMAVLCPEGDNVIKFTYKTRGGTLGIAMTCVGTVTFIIYIAYDINQRKSLTPAPKAKKKNKTSGGKKPEDTKQKPAKNTDEEDETDVSE